MRDSNHRNAFTDLYRIYEGFEEPPKGPDEMRGFLARLNKELSAYYDKYGLDTAVAKHMAFALLDGLVEIMDSYCTKNPPPEQTWMPGVKEWRN